MRCATMRGGRSRSPHPRAGSSAWYRASRDVLRLGCGDALVGITRYCTEPAGAVDAVARVGGTKNPDVHDRRTGTDLVVGTQRRTARKTRALEAAGLTVFVSFSTRTGRRRADHPPRNPDGRLPGQRSWARDGGGPPRDPTGDTSPRVLPDLEEPVDELQRDTYATTCWNTPAASTSAAIARSGTAPSTSRPLPLGAEVILLPDEPYVFRPKDLARSLRSSGRRRAIGRVYFVDARRCRGTDRAPLRAGYFRAVLSEVRVPLRWLGCTHTGGSDDAS